VEFRDIDESIEPGTLACAAEHGPRPRFSRSQSLFGTLIDHSHLGITVPFGYRGAKEHERMSARTLRRRHRKGDILQVGSIKKGEKKLCTTNIGQSMEQLMARPGSRKMRLASCDYEVRGGSTVLDTERPDCGERGMCASGGSDPEI
jgi:hypothetical protein